MKTLKHTPAPWLVDEVDCMVYGANNLRVADCTCDDQEEMTDDAMEANARLIAAAPELLEALERIANNGAPYDNCYEDLKNVARAAIAKAEGNL